MNRHARPRVALLAFVSLTTLFMSGPGNHFVLGSPTPPSGLTSTRIGGLEPFVPGEIIVELKEHEATLARGRLAGDSASSKAELGVASLDTLGARFGVRSIRPVTAVAPPGAARVSPLARFFHITLGPGQDALQAARAYRKDSSVQSAQVNYIYAPDQSPPQNVPNDTLFSTQYSHSLTHASEGWVSTTGSPTVAIAIIGTGVQLNHPDLAGNIYTNPGEIPGNGLDDDVNGKIDDVHGWDYSGNDNDPNPALFDPSVEKDGHETAAAGVAAAVTNNALDIAGVCWTCRILPIRVAYETTSVANGIDYAVAMGAKVVNLSLGSSEITKYGPDTLVQTAIDNAFAHNIVVVASAGNDATDVKHYPGALDNAIAVSATQTDDSRAVYSNFGSWVDVAAPGHHVITTSFTASGNETDFANGTSFSAPYVAGLAGLILAKNPGLSAQQVRLIIEYSADPIDTDHYIGSGRVNVKAALDLNDRPAVAAVIKSPENRSILENGLVTFFGTALGSSYLLEYKPRSGTVWTTIQVGTETIDNTLGSLDTSSFPVGAYDVRLTASSGGSQKQAQTFFYLHPPFHPGWPQNGDGTPILSHPVTSDLDGDGRQEIIIGTLGGAGGKDKVFVYKEDGTLFPGTWPKEAADTFNLFGSPSVGDINGDGQPDIVVTTYNDGYLAAFKRDGTTIWPSFKVGDTIRGAATLANLDADPRLEILVASGSGVVHAYKTSTGSPAELTNWPKSLDINIQTTPAVADIDADGQPDIVIRQYSNLYVLKRDGSAISPFPLAVGANAYISSVLGDIDGNRSIDIVDVEAAGAVTAYSSSGATLFRRVLPAQFELESPALGDLDGDGKMEIFVGDATGKVWGLDFHGDDLSESWPVTMGGGAAGAPVIADIDGDGEQEITVASADGFVYSWNADGSPALEPIFAGGPVVVSPVIADLDGDGTVELIIATTLGRVYVYDLGSAWDPMNANWPMFQGNARHTGYLGLDTDRDGDPNVADCAPFDPAIHHGAVEACNQVDDDCDTLVDEIFDVDGDGYTTCGGDCNDLAPEVRPGVTELCNNYDDNCNGQVDEGFDGDSDGYTICSIPTPDCNNANASIHPGAAETCNNLDDNCNGYVDEGSQFDQDSDGWTICALPTPDCNDNDARINGVEREYVNSSCFDRLDNDCDGVVDWDCALDVITASNERVQLGSVSPNQPAALNNMKSGSADDVYESITESNNGKRVAVFWTFALPPPNAYSGTVSYHLRVEGLRVPGNGDEFNFSYAQRHDTGPCTETTGETYTPAPSLTVSSTVDNDLLQVFQVGLPNFDTVSFCVKVVDSNTGSDNKADTLKLDKLYLMPIILDAKASGEQTNEGTRFQGSYLSTQTVSNGQEGLREASPNNRLIHTFTFSSVPYGSSHKLYFEAWRPNNADTDNFKFSYALPLADGTPGAFTDIPGALISTPNAPGSVLSGTFGLPGMYGKVFIRIQDTNGGTNLDSVFIDYLAIRTPEP